MSNEKISEAVALIKRGDHSEAKKILSSILQDDPQNVTGWLWFATTFKDKTNQKLVLQRGLDANPGNEKLQNALENLTGKAPALQEETPAPDFEPTPTPTPEQTPAPVTVPTPPAPKPAPPALEPVIRPAPAPEPPAEKPAEPPIVWEIEPEPKPKAPPKEKPKKKRNNLGILLLIAIFGIIAIIVLLFVFRPIFFPGTSAVDPTATSSPTATEIVVTETTVPTWTPTATPEPTDAPTATPTPESDITIDIPADFPGDLYFLNEQIGVSQIWRIRVEDGDLEQLTDEIAGVDEYDINPVAGLLAYTTNNQLVIADGDGGNREMILDGGAGDTEDGIWRAVFQISGPAWSPDGTKLAYGQNGVQIYTLGAATVETLSRNRIPTDEDPASIQIHRPAGWSPDGKWLASEIVLVEGNALEIYPVEGGTPYMPEAPCCDISWSRDGQSFFAAGNSPIFSTLGLWQIDPGTRTTTVLIPGTAESTYFFASHPIQTAAGRLNFFYLESGDALSTQLGIVSTGPDGTSGLTQLTTRAYSPMDSLWAYDASFVLLPDSDIGSLSLLKLDGTPETMLIEEGNISQLRWGISPPSPTSPTGGTGSSGAPPIGGFLPIAPDTAAKVTLLYEMADIYNATHVGFTATDDQLAILGPTRVAIVDYIAGEEIEVLMTGGAARYTAFAVLPGGEQYALGPGQSGTNAIEIRDLDSNTIDRTFPGEDPSTTSIVYSKDGQILAASVFEQGLYVWNLEEDDNNAILPDASETGTKIAISPDGTTVAISNPDGTIFLWNAANQFIIGTIVPGAQPLLPMAFSQDGAVLAVGTGTVIQLWNVERQVGIRQLAEEHLAPITQVTYSPDGEIIASSSRDGSIRLWNAETGELLNTLWAETGTPAFVFSPDGKLIASVNNEGKIRVWGVGP